MIEIQSKKLPTSSDFFVCPIWRYDEDDDLYHPVSTEDEIPESERDLSIRAVFTTPSGAKIDGYVVGISRVFSIALFGSNGFFHANLNLGPESQQWMREFLADRIDLKISSPKEMFPLQYTTQINRVGYRDFSGIFDLV
jgi:hypothetical protein